MSTLTDRIHPWTHRPSDREPFRLTPDAWIAITDRVQTHQSDRDIAILILEDDDWHTWVALDVERLEPVARGGPHPTRHDATIDAIEHVPNWNIIRTL